MTPLTLPESPGITWRPATLDDADDLARNMAEIHRVETLEHVPGPEIFRWLLTQEGFDPSTDMRVAVRDNGEIVADGGTWSQVGSSGARAFIWAETRPGHEALRPGLIAWVKARAHEQLRGRPDDLPATIRFPIDEHRAALRADAEAAGFRTIRSFVVMERNLDDLPEPHRLPDGIRVTMWTPDLDDATRVASNRSFSDHWGSLPQSPEEWRSILTGSGTFRGDLSFLALDGRDVIAFCLCEVDTEDNEARGVDEVYVTKVGTVRGYRRLGIASHLLVRSLEAARDAGLTTAALEVDEQSHTSATEVYRRVGFTTRSRTIHHMVEL